MNPLKLRTLLHRTVILGIISLLSYPVLAGASWLVHLVRNLGKSSSWVSDPISDAGMVIFVGGLTITAALAITYVGMRDWSENRSATRARRTALIGVIAVPFIFALLAITISIINALLHSGNHP
jgi:hypothetical protein